LKVVTDKHFVNPLKVTQSTAFTIVTSAGQSTHSVRINVLAYAGGLLTNLSQLRRSPPHRPSGWWGFFYFLPVAARMAVIVATDAGDQCSALPQE
jgi:hypothetical protein